jgi:hypothetical protein
MAYTIYLTDGTVLSTIAAGEVDSYSTSLDLIGKNVNNYGEYYNNNLVRLLTSFASENTSLPNSPQTGQLWFDKTSKRLKVYDGVTFQPTYGSHVSGVAPVTTSTGDFWYDTVNSQLKVWDGDSYNLVGPATSGLLGKIGILPPPLPIVDANSHVQQKVSVIHSYGTYVGLITTSSFVMETSSSTVYLSGTSLAGTEASIVEGVTLFRDLDVKKNLRVKNSITIDGWDVRYHPNIDLSTYYNITPFGSYTATTTTSSFGLSNSNLAVYNAANLAISRDLAKAFNTSTYWAGSRVSVICAYNTETSVRRFELTTSTIHPDSLYWEPYLHYTYYWSSATTTSINSATWLWDYSTATNIVIEGQ